MDSFGSSSPRFRSQPVGRFARRIRSRSNVRMADDRTISQLEAEGFDQLGAKMKCNKCGKRPERYYPANQSDTPGFVRSF
jgi:hypothetical protein